MNPTDNCFVYDGMEVRSFNIYPDSKGRLRSVEFKSLKGLLKLIKTIDRNCLKTKFVMELRIQLPIVKVKHCRKQITNPEED